MAEAILSQGFERTGFVGMYMPRDHRARKRLEDFTDTLAEVADRVFFSGGSALLKEGAGAEYLLRRHVQAPEA